jgi:hypothetical protein
LRQWVVVIFENPVNLPGQKIFLIPGFQVLIEIVLTTEEILFFGDHFSIMVKMVTTIA